MNGCVDGDWWLYCNVDILLYSDLHNDHGPFRNSALDIRCHEDKFIFSSIFMTCDKLNYEAGSRKLTKNARIYIVFMTGVRNKWRYGCISKLSPFQIKEKWKENPIVKSVLLTVVTIKMSSVMLCSFAHMGTNGLEGSAATIFGVELSAAENINPAVRKNSLPFIWINKVVLGLWRSNVTSETENVHESSYFFIITKYLAKATTA